MEESSFYFIFLQTLILDDTTRGCLNEIFVVKRLETMIEIFTLCLQMACSFKSTGMCPVYDDDRLSRPLKKYLSDFVWRLLLGVESNAVTFILCGLLERINVDIDSEINLVDIGAQNIVSMEDLCRKGVDAAVKSGKLSSIDLNRGSQLCLNLDMTWRKLATVTYLHQLIGFQREGLRRAQLLLTAHLWMYEEAIATQPGFAIITPLNRAAILMQLNKATQALSTWKMSVQKMRDEMMVLVTAITQRLKWAVGANPGLQQLMTSFIEHVTIKRDLTDKIGLLAAVALKNCTSVLKYETLRVSTPEALEEDQSFLNLISRWEKSCMMAQSCSTAVTSVEEALVELLDPEGPIDRSWLNNVASLIDDMTDQVQRQINKIEKEIVSSQDELNSCAYRLRGLMVVHHRVVANVRALMKSTIRFVDGGAFGGGVKDYLKKYKPVLDAISELHGHILSKDFTEVVVNSSLVHIAEVLAHIQPMYDELLLIESSFDADAEAELERKGAVAQIQLHDASRPNSPLAKAKTQKGRLSGRFSEK